MEQVENGMFFVVFFIANILIEHDLLQPSEEEEEEEQVSPEEEDRTLCEVCHVSLGPVDGIVTCYCSTKKVLFFFLFLFIKLFVDAPSVPVLVRTTQSSTEEGKTHCCTLLLLQGLSTQVH